jgi:hypothetical protein
MKDCPAVAAGAPGALAGAAVELHVRTAPPWPPSDTLQKSINAGRNETMHLLTCGTLRTAQ